MNIRYKRIIDERFDDYKDVSLFIGSCFCDFKCCKEAELPIEICQNSHLNNENTKTITYKEFFDRYINNPITSSIVIGGLEPILQINEILGLIKYFRKNNITDPFIIYTGYKESEINSKIEALSKFENIIVKFGRYIPNQQKHFDKVLGVELASDNQYAVKIS